MWFLQRALSHHPPPMESSPGAALRAQQLAPMNKQHQVTARQQCCACRARTRGPATQVRPAPQHCASTVQCLGQRTAPNPPPPPPRPPASAVWRPADGSGGRGDMGPWARGWGGRGGDESDAMDAAPTVVWRRPVRPGRGSRIWCVRWNRLQVLRHQTPDTTSTVVCPPPPPSSTVTRATRAGRPQGRAALSAPWGPSNCLADVAAGADLCLRVVRLDWGGGVGGWVRGLWVGGLVWFWAIWPKVPTPPPGGGWGLGGWVGGWVGRGWVGPDSSKLTG